MAGEIRAAVRENGVKLPVTSAGHPNNHLKYAGPARPASNALRPVKQITNGGLLRACNVGNDHVSQLGAQSLQRLVLRLTEAGHVVTHKACRQSSAPL